MKYLLAPFLGLLLGCSLFQKQEAAAPHIAVSDCVTACGFSGVDNTELQSMQLGTKLSCKCK